MQPTSMFRSALLLALALGATAARAEVRVDGNYRFRLAFDTDLMLDDQPNRLGQTAWAEHRLRLSPKLIEPGVAEIQASFDILSGLVAGGTAPNFQGLGWTERSEKNGIRAGGFDFRHLFAEIRFPFGLLQFGQMPSNWGMGMVTNGGNDEAGPDFGDVRFGDIVERVLFATRPFAFLGPRSELGEHVALALGADIVYRDRYAELIVRNGGGLQWGDTAYQAVAALRWDPTEKTRVGFYSARRVQSFRQDGGNLHIWIFDAHARTLIGPEIFGGATLALEAEAAEIYGGTSHATNLNALASTRIAQQGGALRANLSVTALESEIELGYASGDTNPFDQSSTAFSMNRDFKVGLVLFDEVLLFQSQNAARRLADPALSGRPPNGVDLIPTEGAVTNAMYLKPTFRWRPGFFGGKVRFVGSALFARAPQPVVDPYQALVASAQRNSYGAPAGKNYGTELDGAVSWQTQLGSAVGVELGVQGGVLFPGDVFDRPASDGAFVHMDKAYAVKMRAGFQF